jgi:hypothetical protein
MSLFRSALSIARRSRLRVAAAFAVAAAAASPAPVRAQDAAFGPRAGFAPPSASPAADSAGARLKVMLLTMGPGDQVWEKFGHNALWVHDPASGEDLAYNYGMFDFQQANFYSNFARGHMLYWMQAFDALGTVEAYARQNRSVWVQELDLTPRQKLELKSFLEWNAREENKFYRYDYYRDNCSTRVRDVIDRVVGGAVRRQFGPVPSRVTYRSETERLTADDVPTYTGLMIGLAEPADVPISAWDEMFLPMSLRDHLRKARVPGPDGEMVPLVKNERMAVASAGREPTRTEPPRRIPVYLLVGTLIGIVLMALAWKAHRSRGARIGYAVLAGLWTLVTGVGGVVLAALWLFTDHAIAYRNENLFQLDPISLPLVVLLPALAFGARWATRWGPRIAQWVGYLSIVGFAVQVLPGIDQVNGVVIALAMPINMALAWTAVYLRERWWEGRADERAAADAGRAPARVAPAAG